MILPAMRRVFEVLAAGDGQPGIEVIVQPPEHVVAIEAVLLDAQDGGFIRIVAEALRC